MTINFKHYCAVFFNPTDGLNEEVSKICEEAHRTMKGKGISIYTFTSIVEAPILTEYFKSYGRNFLLFDLKEENSGFNFIDKVKENDLFGFLKSNESNKDFEKLSNTLMDDILKDIHGIKESTPDVDISSIISNNPYLGSPITPKGFEIYQHPELEEYSLNIDEDMSKKDINEMVNKIIDKGVENLTDLDKKMLDKLSNLR
jgi:hypothetical protein